MDDIDDIMNADAPADEIADDTAPAPAPAPAASVEDGTATGAPDLPVEGQPVGAAGDGGSAPVGTGIELDDLAAEQAGADAPQIADGVGKNPSDSGQEGRAAAELRAVFDVPVQISAVLGHTEIEVSDMLQLDTGAIIKLDRKVGEAIDIYVNDRLVARGEVVIVDNRLGITMTEIIKQDSA